MTIRAYNELYLSDAQSNLANAFDYAINVCKQTPDIFAKIFSRSEYAKKFECGDPAIVSGKSGVELVKSILAKINIFDTFPEPQFSQDRSPEYWAGWAIAYYQWYSAKRFKDIFARIPLSQIILMYKVFHEMDIMAFVESMEKRYAEVKVETKLRSLREARGLSQRELSNVSGVKLRSIQLFEQKVNDIDKAQAHTLYKLARVLGCTIEDLLENPEQIL
ncbi:MAG: helix-turn-helix domain-containing protein [Clostridiales bacterium]|nr:helix-turn-helix domain-containing protein [Clostridiales bacterium]